MHPGGAQLCSVCCQPPPEEFPTTSPVSPWDHQKGGSPGKLPTTTHARNETHGDDLTRVMRGLTIWTTTPNPQQHPLSLARPATQQPCSPKCLASAHRHTFSLRCPNSIASVPNRPARCQAPAPSPVLTTWFTSRSASRNIPTQTNTLPNIPFPVRCFPTPPKKNQQHYRRNLPLPSAEGYAVWLFRGQSNCHVIKNPPCAAVDRRPPLFRTCRMPGSRPCLACQICTQQVGRDAHLNPRHRPCLTRR